MLVRKINIFAILFILLVSCAYAYQEQQGQSSFLAIWTEYPAFYANYTGQGDCTIRFNDNNIWTDPVYMQKIEDNYELDYNLSEGSHEWTVSCFDGNENLLLTDTVEIKSTKNEEDDYGSIEWKKENPFGKEEQEHTIVDYRLASADTSILDPSANTSARITLKNTDIFGRPKICYRPGFSEFYTEVVGQCRDCEADGICTLINYTDGEVVFDVKHFTSFAVDGPSGTYEAPEFSTTALIIILTVLGIGFFIYKKKFE